MLIAAPETVYGTAAASGYYGLDFKSCDLSSAIPLGDDPLLGRGRNAQDPYRGLVTDEGNAEIPFDVQGIGWWLTALFGAPTTTGAGPYTHVWKSGSDTIPFYTVEVGHPKLTTPVFFLHTGVVMESLAFDLGVEGPANGRIGMVAQGETSSATSKDDTPTRYALTRFSQGRGYIKKGGVQLANVTAGNFNFSNTLERVRTIRPDGKIDAADPTIAVCNGQMTVRFDGVGLVAEAEAGDPIELDYGFISGGSSLNFNMPRVFLPKPKYSVAGPGGVQAQFDWRAAYDAGDATMLTATLINNVASYA
ncbi:MAG: phage tail tube protein [Rhodospirillales bacterium]